MYFNKFKICYIFLGFIIIIVMEKVFGVFGFYFFLMIVFMVLMVIGLGEIMVIFFIFVYDIYKIYIGFFRLLIVYCKDFYLKINKYVFIFGGIIIFVIFKIFSNKYICFYLLW